MIAAQEISVFAAPMIIESPLLSKCPGREPFERVLRAVVGQSANDRATAHVADGVRRGRGPHRTGSLSGPTGIGVAAICAALPCASGNSGTGFAKFAKRENDPKNVPPHLRRG